MRNYILFWLTLTRFNCRLDIQVEEHRRAQSSHQQAPEHKWIPAKLCRCIFKEGFEPLAYSRQAATGQSHDLGCHAHCQFQAHLAQVEALLALEFVYELIRQRLHHLTIAGTDRFWRKE